MDTETQEKTPEPTPDDVGAVNVEAFLKIIDPETGETLLATRA